MTWFGNLDTSPPGKTWCETSTEDYGAITFHNWRCRSCRRTAVTQGSTPPTACACEAAK